MLGRVWQSDLSADRKDKANAGLRQKTGLVVDRVCVRGCVEAEGHRRADRGTTR